MVMRAILTFCLPQVFSPFWRKKICGPGEKNSPKSNFSFALFLPYQTEENGNLSSFFFNK